MKDDKGKIIEGRPRESIEGEGRLGKIFKHLKKNKKCSGLELTGVLYPQDRVDRNCRGNTKTLMDQMIQAGLCYKVVDGVDFKNTFFAIKEDNKKEGINKKENE